MRYFEAGQEEGTIMRQPAQPGSELTRLLERMQCAYAAAHQGLGQGTACQQCSDATWQRGHQAHQQRAALVGPDQARTLRAHAIWTAEALDRRAVVAPSDRDAAPPDTSTGTLPTTRRKLRE